MAIIYSFIGALLRLWYGYDNFDNKWLNSRAVQTIPMILVLFTIFCRDYTDWFSVLYALCVSCWIQFQYWSRGHGPAIDTGKVPASDKDISRYMDRWYGKVCDKLLPNDKYGFLYDNLWLGLRYGCPMLVVSLLEWNIGFFFIGLSIPFIYTFANKLEDTMPYIFNDPTWYWRRGWCLAEMLSGAVTYGGCYLLTNH